MNRNIPNLHNFEGLQNKIVYSNVKRDDEYTIFFNDFSKSFFSSLKQ